MEASLRKIHMKIFSRFNKKGFTLIELLAVIAIIAILAAMGLVAYSSAQASARDAKRIGDMKVLQNAFEQYAADHQGAYASCETMWSDAQTTVQPTTDTQGDSYTCTGNATSYCACSSVLETVSKANSGAACNWTAASLDRYCVGSLQ